MIFFHSCFLPSGTLNFISVQINIFINNWMQHTREFSSFSLKPLLQKQCVLQAGIISKFHQHHNRLSGGNCALSSSSRKYLFMWPHLSWERKSGVCCEITFGFRIEHEKNNRQNLLYFRTSNFHLGPRTSSCQGSYFLTWPWNAFSLSLHASK